jgi:hypothetical protein
MLMFDDCIYSYFHTERKLFDIVGKVEALYLVVQDNRKQT